MEELFILLDLQPKVTEEEEGKDDNSKKEFNPLTGEESEVRFSVQTMKLPPIIEI